MAAFIVEFIGRVFDIFWDNYGIIFSFVLKCIGTPCLSVAIFYKGK